jgi:hypothetical protein
LDQDRTQAAARPFRIMSDQRAIQSQERPEKRELRQERRFCGGWRRFLLRRTLDDAIALALEDNLEIAMTRYDLPIAQTDLLRAKGGGIDRVGSTGCCDPNLRVSYGWSNAITPLNYTVVSGEPIDTTHQESASAGYSQGFPTGTSLFVAESSSRLTSNTTKSIYNPELVRMPSNSGYEA